MEGLLCARYHTGTLYSSSQLIITAAYPLKYHYPTSANEDRVSLWKLNVSKMMTLASARGHVHAQIGLAPSICSLYYKYTSNKH